MLLSLHVWPRVCDGVHLLVCACIYTFPASAWSQLWLAGSSRCSKWDPVPRPEMEPKFSAIGSAES